MDNMKKNDTERIDLFNLLHKVAPQLRRFWGVVLALIVLGGALAFVRCRLNYTPMYQAQAVFSVSISVADDAGIMGYSYYYDNSAAQMVADTFPYILNSDVMRELIRQRLGSDVINGTITPSSVADTNFFVLTATSPNAQDAYDLINAVIDVYPQVSRQVIGETQLVINRQPMMPTLPYNTMNWTHSVLKGSAAGLVLGLIFICIMTSLRKTVYSSNDVKKMLNLSCLAHVPNVTAKRRKSGSVPHLLVTEQQPDSAFCESMRLLRLKLLRQLKADDKIILFTSSVPSEGKSSLAANTALLLAQDNKRVLLVDADLRNPSIKPLLNLTQPSFGLGECLHDKLDRVRFLHYGDTGLYIFSGDSDKGIDNPTPLLQQNRLADIFEPMRSMFDYIIIDTPPCGMLADAATLSVYADKVVYVIREDFASMSQIYDGVQSLSNQDVDICGFVLNRTSTNHNGHYGYGYGYGYGYHKNKD